MTYRMILALAMLVAAWHIGCGGRDPSDPASEPAKPAVLPAPPRNPKIPAEISYPIIEDEEAYNSFTKKRMVEVRLNMKVSPDVLREIALQVKATERHQYERTFIFVKLPEKVAGVENEAWATCHFAPTLNVSILGLTKEDEESLRKLPMEHKGKRIGAWLIEMQFASHMALIYEDAGTIKLASIGLGGARFDTDMVELPAQGGRRFQANGSDEVYDVDPSGVLRMYNRDGKVFAAALPLN
jgi:hypothetical protein